LSRDATRSPRCAPVRLGSVALRYRLPRPWRGLAPRRLGRSGWRDNAEAAGGGETVRDPPVARLEAVLFLAREPLTSRKLAQLADLADGTKARTLVRGLNRFYDREGCAFRVVQVAGGYQLMTRPQFAPWLRRLHRWGIEVRLSAPALETLAVVAYRQPVLRVTIEAIRGVQCGEILRQLMERDLVRIAGRSEELGRPFLYGTTRRFLQVFGLRSLEALPRHEWFDLPAPRADGTDENAPSHDHNDIPPNPADPRIAASSPIRYKDGPDRGPAGESDALETRASSPNQHPNGSD
jgi:segregation and condensation protein B